MKKLLNIFNFSTFRFYYKYIGNKLLVQIFLSILISLLDSLGLSMFFPLFEIISGDSSTSKENSKIYLVLEKIFNFIHFEINIVNILILLSIFFILKGIVQYLYTIFFTNVRMEFIRDLRIELIDDLNNYSYKSFVKSDAGRVQNVLTGEIDRLANGYINYFSMIQNMIFVIIYVVIVFVIDFQFAILVAIGGVITNLLFSQIFNYTKKVSNDLTQKNNSFQGFVIQFMNNFKYLKATGNMNKYSEMLVSDVRKIEKNGKMIGKLSGIVTAVREPILIIIISVVIIIQLKFLGGNLSTILVSLLFFYRALGYLMVMQNSYNNFLMVSGSFQNILGISEEMKKDRERFENLNSAENLQSKIELKNAIFAYEDATIIHKLDLTIQKNESIALIGESGSGKTTLANIIAGLYTLNSGELRIDGQLIEKLKINEYRNKIGYITQESVIFSDTIYNNISFWAPKTPQNLQKFKEAIEKASIHKFIDTLPLKEDTILGNNGINLSGGQRQRISIARELYKNAEILILDEATSALDSETESEIKENIDKIKGDCTLIVIAHRLSTIKDLDRIIILNKGKIVDQGSFNELFSRNTQFQNLINHQGHS
jgi:ABC-type multidrug transport system fused ATPase/permease subunit